MAPIICALVAICYATGTIFAIGQCLMGAFRKGIEPAPVYAQVVMIVCWPILLPIMILAGRVHVGPPPGGVE